MIGFCIEENIVCSGIAINTDAFSIPSILLIKRASSPSIARTNLILLSSLVEVKSPLSKISKPTFWSYKPLSTITIIALSRCSVVHFFIPGVQSPFLSLKTDFVPSTARAATILFLANRAWISSAFPKLSVVSKSTSSFKGSLLTSICSSLDLLDIAKDPQMIKITNTSTTPPATEAKSTLFSNNFLKSIFLPYIIIHIHIKYEKSKFEFALFYHTLG